MTGIHERETEYPHTQKVVLRLADEVPTDKLIAMVTDAELMPSLGPTSTDRHVHDTAMASLILAIVAAASVERGDVQ